MRASLCLLAILFGTTSLVHRAAAQEKQPVQGVLSMSGKPYTLVDAVAYPSKRFDKPSTTVIASDRAINADSVLRSLKENNGDDRDVDLRQPHVKVVFDASGKIVSCYATAAGFTTNTTGDALSGEVKLDGDRVTGTAKLAEQGEGDLRRSFEFKFSLGMLGTAAYQPKAAGPLAKLGVSGTFRGNGKDAKLAYVTARVREPFGDKPSLMLVITEQDHSKADRPDFGAGFGDFGSALIISCHDNGNIFGCEVSHAAHEKRPFSSIGSITIGEFQIAGGQVQGRLTTNGDVTSLGEKWSVDLQFAAPFAGWPKATETNTTASSTPASSKSGKAKTTEAPSGTAKAGGKLNVKDLAILQGVDDVEYKAIVEQIVFKSPENYKTLAGQLVKKLDAQGWQKDGSDLIGVSAILKRKMGDATLTIFVKPAPGGSTVMVMSKGLNWK